MRTTFLDTREDIDWLFSTHLKNRGNQLKEWNCKAAFLTGNEDCPTRIELFYVIPKFNSKPRWVFHLQDDLSYKC